MSSTDPESALDSDSPKLKFKRRSLAGRRKLCPECLSDLQHVDSISGWLAPAFYFCSKCGYSGHVALEEMPKKKKNEKKEEEDD